jgi:REP element-mobilizing transposase RayT
MPDHVHALVEGLRPDSDFLMWLGLWRQLTGFYERRETGNDLWQEGYWDYTLRDQESVPGIASYIVWNPVVAGLVATPEAYPFTGSERYSIRALAAIPPTKPRFGDL